MLLVWLLSGAPARAGADAPDSARAGLRRDSYKVRPGAGWTVDSLTVAGLEEPGVRRVRASGRIRLPLASVWRVLADQVNGPGECWPGLKECEVESASGDTIVARYIAPLPVFRDRRYRLRNVVDGEARQVIFELVPGYGNVRSVAGRWRAVALGDSLTRVDYHADIDPGTRWIPGFIVNWATKSAIPRLY